MASPFTAASRRQGSNPTKDYQSPAREYRGPRGPAANENQATAPFAPSRIPQTGSGIPDLTAPARQVADSLLRKFPAYRIGRIAFDLYRRGQAIAGLDEAPDYSPHYRRWYECEPMPPDVGGYPPYMGEFNSPQEGLCGGIDFYRPEFWPGNPDLDNPGARMVGNDIPSTWGGMAYFVEVDYIGANLWKMVKTVYQRVEQGVATYKGMYPARSPRPANWGAPAPGTLPWPGLAPEAMPIGEALPTPHPVPLAWLKFRLDFKPWRAPSEQSQRGPAPTSRPDRGLVPGQEVGVTVSIDSRGKPQIRAGLAYRRAPPGPRKKEQKIQVRGVKGVLLAVNAVTEGFDFVDALYDALPKEFKKDGIMKGLRRSLRPQEKMWQLFQHWDQVPMKQAIKNLIENQAEDFAFGSAGQGMKKLNREMGRPVGVQAGQGGPGKVPKGTQMGKKPWDKWTDYIWP